MLQLHNHSPLAALMFAALDEAGRDTVILVIKASFELRPGQAPVLVAEHQRAVTLGDEYWGEPTASSLRYASEVHLPKPGTDVIVNGDACAPHGRAVTELELLVRVGERSKLARVFGERVWIAADDRVIASRPQPFVRIPVIWERAFGGREPGEDGRVESRNPVGVGLVDPRRGAAALHGQPLPNIEDPRELLRGPGHTPAPVGFGAIAPTWSPRVEWVGSYDARWREQRAPLLPEDFDARFFQVASSGLSFDPPLRGGEPVSLRGFDPDHELGFTLPRVELELSACVRGSTQPLAATLDTVLLEPSDRRFEMTWRASTIVAHTLALERVELRLAGLEHAELST